MTEHRLKAIKGGNSQRRGQLRTLDHSSTCISCDDEGRIWMGYSDAGKLRWRFCWCEIGQDLKQQYCEEKQCRG